MRRDRARRLAPAGRLRRRGNWRSAAAGPGQGSGPLLVAHDWADARRREALSLAEVLDAFAAPPLDHIRFDLDLKIAGREDEVIAALRERNLIERAMVSTMEADSLVYLRDAAPDLDRGWTLPKVSRDWSRNRWLRPVFLAGSASLRARLPAIIRRGAPPLGVWATWVYHPLITRRLVDVAHGSTSPWSPGPSTSASARSGSPPSASTGSAPTTRACWPSSERSGGRRCDVPGVRRADIGTPIA